MSDFRFLETDSEKCIVDNLFHDIGNGHPPENTGKYMLYVDEINRFLCVAVHENGMKYKYFRKYSKAKKWLEKRK